MIGLFLKLLLILLVVRALWRLGRGVLEGAGYARDGKPGVPLVRDPVCGMYVMPSRALSAGSGSQTLYFCSEKCRKEWADAGGR